MSTEPWSKFYWADWRSEPKLRMCCLGARGLWMELLSLMHESDEYGHLLVNGKTPTEQQLAIMCGASVSEVRKLKVELEVAGVPGIREDGVWFSRRMLKDREKRNRDKVNGSKGGNPKIVAKDKEGVNPPVKSEDDQEVNVWDKARGTRDPEARDQKPEEKLDSAVPSSRATEVIRAFDDARAEVFGEEERRPFPSADDKVFAERFLAAGADVGWLKTFFLDRMSGMKRDGGKKPKSLKYFDDAVPEGLAAYRSAKNKPLSKPNGSYREEPILKTSTVELMQRKNELLQQLQQGKRA
jgi:hypothetical protein